jgi:hypothetical protein
MSGRSIPKNDDLALVDPNNADLAGSGVPR